MRALRKVTAGPGLELVDVPEPACGPKDVKVRVLRAGGSNGPFFAYLTLSGYEEDNE